MRQAIVEYVREDGIEVGIDNVLVTYGARNALDLACRVHLEPGDRVAVANPSCRTALQTLRSHGVSFLAVAQDEEGISADELGHRPARLKAIGERTPKLLFDVPDLHNATGLPMPLARRVALMELAKRHNMIMPEDDPYRRLSFEDGQPAGCIRNLKVPRKEPTGLHFKRGGAVHCRRTPAQCEAGDTLFFTLSDRSG